MNNSNSGNSCSSSGTDQPISEKSVHPKKARGKERKVKICILPKECIFDKNVCVIYSYNYKERPNVVKEGILLNPNCVLYS